MTIIITINDYCQQRSERLKLNNDSNSVYYKNKFFPLQCQKYLQISKAGQVNQKNKLF